MQTLALKRTRKHSNWYAKLPPNVMGARNIKFCTVTAITTAQRSLRCPQLVKMSAPHSTGRLRLGLCACRTALNTENTSKMAHLRKTTVNGLQTRSKKLSCAKDPRLLVRSVLSRSQQAAESSPPLMATGSECRRSARNTTFYFISMKLSVA